MPGSNDNMGTAAGASSDPLRGFDTDAPPNASLSLLVRMPDGKRRQVEVPPNASVRQLRSSIAANIGDIGIGTENSLTDQPPEDWDLRFGESSLQDEHTLDHYNIPNVVDHANAVLKAIHDSDYPTEDKKLEALEGAYQVVAGVSRGEQDMTRLISAAFNEGTENFVLDPSTSQPSIRSMRRRSRPSRIPSINLSQLPPPLPASSSRLSGIPSMPSTPRDLLLRLSHSRPDLYKFSDNNDKSSSIPISPNASNQPTITSAPPPAATGSPILNPASSHTNNAHLSGPNNDRVTEENQQRDAEAKQDNGHHSSQNEGSGELKRGNTWIDYIDTIGQTIRSEEKQEGNGSSEGEAERSDIEGDSEDEPIDDHDNTGNKSNVLQNPFESSNAAGNSNHKAEPQLDPNKNENANSNAQSISNSESPSHENNPMDESRNENSMSKGENSQASDGSPKHDSDHTSNLTKPEQKQVIGLEPQTLSGGPEVKVPKKRGRKRKNPHLTEEQRKQQRQAQNRESAKLSRLRRKNMTIRYERRVNILEVENTNLRDTVSALQKRLEMLQNLLTITVRPSGGHLPGASRPGPPAPVGLIPPVSGQPQMGPPTGIPGAPVVAPSSVMGTHPGLGTQPQVGLQTPISTGHQLAMPHPQLSTQSRLGPQPQLGPANPFGAPVQRSAQMGVGLPHTSGASGSVPMSSSAQPVSQPGLANGGSVARSSARRQNPLANLEYRNY